MLTPQQQQAYSQTIGAGSPGFSQSFEQFLQPQSQEGMQEEFQRSYVDPAMQAYQQNVLPAIQSQFSDLDAGSSSALNQAIAQSASDLSTTLGSQYGQLAQQQRQNQLSAMGLFSPFLSQQTFSPLLQQQNGILGPLIGAAGQIGAGAMGNPGMFLSKLLNKGGIT